MDTLEALKRIIKRERDARKQAEQIIEEKSRELFVVNNQLKELNASLEDQVNTRTVELKKKIVELNNSNKYKSEFLANMSHELRTPLNSILILARMLRDNTENNFTPKQKEYASVILDSGKDLLSLINDILDLAKIEAGRVELLIEGISILEIKKDLSTMFDNISREKKVDFEISLSPRFPAVIKTDKTKLLQVLRNLLSNAFKFTDSGGRISLAIEDMGDMVSYTVKDTGIGIEQNKLGLVFEAFRQADGSTSRRFGGTGLGLSICRELVALMNGHISVESQLGTGSVFQVRLPMNPDNVEVTPLDDLFGMSTNTTQLLEQIKDVNVSSDNDKQPILIIEDDERFVGILQDYAKEKGFNVVVASQGDTGLYFAKKFKPLAILLDIQLPIMNGWEVLKELKTDSELANIPVHIFSIVDKPKLGISMGADTYNIKPVNIQDLEDTFAKILEKRNLQGKECMILGKNSKIFPIYYQAFQEHFSNVRFASDYKVALDIIRDNDFGALIIIDNDLNGMGFDEFAGALADIHRNKSEKLKIYMPPKKSKVLHELSDDQYLDFISDEKTLKKDFGIELAKSFEEKKGTATIENMEFLKGCKILLVEDEMRNVFVLDSLLEPSGAIITIANNGREALDELEKNNDFDLILMDIMMPVMNGFEAMRLIRENQAMSHLKIIAVTAKAMTGDAEKCLEAGADAYVSKPIDIDELYVTMGKLIS